MTNHTMLLLTTVVVLVPTAAAAAAATTAATAATAAATAAAAAASVDSTLDLQYPPLSVIEGVLLTTAGEAFGGHQGTFEASAEWHGKTKLKPASDRPAPYLACTSPDKQQANGFKALSYLRGILRSSSAGLRVVSNSDEHGVCILATATPKEADAVRKFQSDEKGEGSPLSFWAPFPSTLKLAPGLLNHEGHHVDHGSDEQKDNGRKNRQLMSRRREDASGIEQQRGRRLLTTHGESLVRSASGSSEVHGLSIELAPGVLPATNRRRRRATEVAGTRWYENSNQLEENWREAFMSESLDVHDTSYWSSGSAMLKAEDGNSPNDTPVGAMLAREWTRAGDVLHELGGGVAKPTIGDVCSWNEMEVYHTDDGLLTMKGIDHLLPGGRGAGGRDGEEADELHVACFMGLLSFLAARPEVLRISAARKPKLLNAAAFPNVQSATLTETPLTDSGLDGTGEIVDTGLDYNSCYFVDNDGKEVPHGHYFEEMGVQASALSSWNPSFSFTPELAQVFTGGDFSFNLGRRKIVQYIDLIRQETPKTTANPPYGASWATPDGDGRFPWLSPTEFGEDAAAGHGTHTAGSAAGATISSPATTEVCQAGRELSCVGGCIDVGDEDSGDDLLPAWEDVYWFARSDAADLDRLCPRYGCDGQSDSLCLSNDESTTLADHGGIARGAKLAIFDIVDGYTGIGIEMTGNGVWQPAMEAGSKLHSNSWGSSQFCEYLPSDVLYDSFMYDNPENLLIFAAGNDGGQVSRRSCIIGSPALAKNVLAVGASTSGPGRLTWTGQDGGATNGKNRVQNIDTMAYFSSFGPALDGRIKPEVVAPGDLVYSAAGGGTGEYTCRLWNYPGTSMACPLVAGAGALIRQYFKDAAFYANDVKTRGLCGSFGCNAFSPSAATVKAMLINSANLMGGSSEPNGIRGFGRVHLEPGMPLKGKGSAALFVADSANTSTTELTLTEYSFAVDGNAGLDFRATLCWIDPPATSFSAVQLVHDLDLAVYSPNRTRYSMWSSGAVDVVNNNERVVVPARTVGGDPGTWVVRVWSKRLAGSVSQSYSLVVTGAIGPSNSGSGGIIAKVAATSSWTDDDVTDEEQDVSGDGRSMPLLYGGAVATVLWLSAGFAAFGRLCS